MGSWQGVDYREIEIPDDPLEMNTQQRRAYIYERVKDLGHPQLIDKEQYANKFDVSRRQIYYDLDAIAEFVEEHIGEDHVMKGASVFDKAVRELVAEGQWEEAAKVLKDEAEWLEKRGAIDKEAEEHEISWREVMQSDDEE